MIAKADGKPVILNETAWKIVEVSMDQDNPPMLHMKNISKPGAHATCCGREIANVTGIPPEYWAHSLEEYQWCEQCESRMLRVGRAADVRPPVNWLGKC